MIFIKFRLSSTNKECLSIYIQFLLNILKHLNVNYSLTYLPTKIKKITFLKSSHVNKKAQEHFLIKKKTVLLTLNGFFEPNFIKFLVFGKPNSIFMKLITKKGRVV